MARKKLNEQTAKTLLFRELKMPYDGISVTDNQPFSNVNLASDKTYVVKVDEGIKKRFKNGLLKLDVQSDRIDDALNELRLMGYSRFLIEEFRNFKAKEEKYLSFERIREGVLLKYSLSGGVDIEDNQKTVNQVLLTGLQTENDISILKKLALTLKVDFTSLQELINAFQKYYFSFLEINPFIVVNFKLLILDAAVEVDSTGEFFVPNAWTADDFVTGQIQKKTPEEEDVLQIASQSQAALSLTVLNPNGSIFMLLSGGGASIVMADEAYNQGVGKEVANYGEYSGNPTQEETYLYTKNVLSLLKKSNAKKKVLIIGGGVANFTDVRKTFKGITQALAESAPALRQQKVKVFVRRGGPNQAEGLAQMKEFLEKENLYGLVTDPQMPLTEIVTKALGIGKKNYAGHQ